MCLKPGAWFRSGAAAAAPNQQKPARQPRPVLLRPFSDRRLLLTVIGCVVRSCSCLPAVCCDLPLAHFVLLSCCVSAVEQAPFWLLVTVAFVQDAPPSSVLVQDIYARCRTGSPAAAMNVALLLLCLC